MPGARTTSACRRSRPIGTCATPSRARRQPKAYATSCALYFCFHRYSLSFSFYLILGLIHACSELENLQKSLNKNEPSLSRIAAWDSDLLRFDAPRTLRFACIQQAGTILDMSTLLLNSLPTAVCDKAARRQAATGYGQSAIDDADMLKYLANLEHVLRCIQHAALLRLLQSSLESLIPSQGNPFWERDARRLHGGDWFAEWVGGRPPLNSTMPWNIKPSLLVLWGVCWMFYKGSSRPRARQQQAGGWVPTQQAVAQSNVDIQGSYATCLPVVTQGRKADVLSRLLYCFTGVSCE